tara:strand:+ start:332 stop:544 length:213 start_codon:yes stop_codon:yes gene_type:complete
MTYQFQLNVMGTVQASTEKEACLLMRKALKKMKHSEMVKSTNYFYMKDGSYEQGWLKDISARELNKSKQQ